MKHIFLSLAALLPLSALCAAEQPAAADKPDIVFILADLVADLVAELSAKLAEIKASGRSHP